MINIRCVNTPTLKHRCSFNKFCFINSLILTIINLFEGNKKLIILPQILKKIPKFFPFGDVAVTMFGFSFLLSLSSHICSHKNRFRFKKLRKLYNVSHTLIYLSKRDIPVPVYIESTPIFFTSSFVLCSVSPW